MSSLDHPREPRAPRTPRKPRARISLKMQAIGFLSRREHSRQELRAKLLDSLRKRAREEAAQAAAADKAARDLAQALSEQPSNGIDDAFAPASPAPAVAPGARGDARARAGAQAGRQADPQAGAKGSTFDRGVAMRSAAPARPGLDTLSLASGAPLPPALKATLAATAATASTSMSSTPPGRRAAPTLAAPMPAARTEHREPMPEAFDQFADADADADAFHAVVDDADDAANRTSGPLAATDQELLDPEAAVDELLDWLVANKYLSETRFVESRVNARSRKQGTLLIKLELARHGLALEPEQAATLRETEFARAHALWQRKFGEPAPDARGRAKQARFLAARGFAADVVRRVVGGQDED